VRLQSGHLNTQSFFAVVNANIFGIPMNKLFNSNWHNVVTLTLFLSGALMTTDSFARGLYKSVGVDGKITYSNHPTVDSQSAKNVSSLKASPRFSLNGKPVSQGTKRS
jgi:hypothetical protein